MIRREITNKIRYVLDEWIPPVIRDSYWFMYPFFFFAYHGKDIKQKMHFKSLVHNMTDQEYQDFYCRNESISSRRLTDLSESNIQYILKNIAGNLQSIVDIGCSKGYLLDRIKKISPDARLCGVDLQNQLQFDGIEFVKSGITRLPFADNSFDLVICTHTIEHIVPLQQAINELVRVTKKKLIIVTPRQRYYYYTIDGHVNFFYKKEELLRYLPFSTYSCIELNMDWVFIGEKIENGEDQYQLTTNK